MRKIANTQFTLASQAGRVALLLGVLDGTVQEREVKAAVAADVEKRKHSKPVVAAGMWFPSVNAAARYLAREDKHIDVCNLAKTIARKCNADCWEGFYWSE